MVRLRHPRSPAATVGSEAIAGVEGGAKLEARTPLNRDFTRIVRRQTELLSEAVADADATSGSGNQPKSKDSKGLNTTPVVWICVILVAIVLLIIFYVLGHRRQDKRDELAGVRRRDEERKIPQIGIVS